jgi:N-acetylglucosamine-6-phosphate deacetylase
LTISEQSKQADSLFPSPGTPGEGKGGGTLVHAVHYATGEPISILFGDGIFAEISPLSPDAGDISDLPIAAPGLTDLQVNGYCGHDLNQTPMPPETLTEITRLLWRAGVTMFFPTIITNTPAAIAQAMESIATACDTDTNVRRAVGGIHLEGPFISPLDGPRGAHRREHVIAPDWEMFCRWQNASGGRIRILTMSPEWPNSPAFVEQCAISGVTVSIGHTAATVQQIRDAVSAGARMSTHLGNGCHLTLPRHPNYLWEQLAQDNLWGCLIADGFHLPDEVMKVIMKVKGDRAMLVSDAVSLTGMPAGTYTMPVGGQVVLTPHGKLHLAANDQLLAGSAQTLLNGVEHLINSKLATRAQAWEMASTRPAGFMRLPSAGGLAEGAPADLVLFRQDNNSRIVIECTFKAGARVYAS